MQAGDRVLSMPRNSPAAASDARASSPPSTAGTVGTAGAPKKPSARDAFFDNAKFFAILLVVMGHMTVPLDDMRAVSTAYRLVYIFHMPAFILISGYFAKNFDFSKRKIQRLVAGVAVPYATFWAVYNVINHYALGNDYSRSPLSPVWLTWFLAALLLWRLSVPVWRWIRWPLPIAVAVAILANGFHIGGMFDMTRAVELLPFFVLGLVLRREHFDYLRLTWVRVASGVVLAGTAIAIFVFAPNFDNEWVYWRKTLVDMHYHPWLQGMALRMVMLVAAVTLVAAFLALVPRGHAWYTKLGAGTIYAYLLHGAIIRLGEGTGLYDHIDNPAGAIGAAVAAGGIAIGLMSPPVQRLTHWFIEPKLNWLFSESSDNFHTAKKQDAAAIAPGRSDAPAAGASTNGREPTSAHGTRPTGAGSYGTEPAGSRPAGAGPDGPGSNEAGSNGSNGAGHNRYEPDGARSDGHGSSGYGSSGYGSSGASAQPADPDDPWSAARRGPGSDALAARAQTQPIPMAAPTGPAMSRQRPDAASPAPDRTAPGWAADGRPAGDSGASQGRPAGNGDAPRKRRFPIDPDAPRSDGDRSGHARSTDPESAADTGWDWFDRPTDR